MKYKKKPVVIEAIQFKKDCFEDIKKSYELTLYLFFINIYF